MALSIVSISQMKRTAKAAPVIRRSVENRHLWAGTGGSGNKKCCTCIFLYRLPPFLRRFGCYSRRDSAVATDSTMTCCKASRSTYFCAILLNDWSAGNLRMQNMTLACCISFVRLDECCVDCVVASVTWLIFHIPSSSSAIHRHKTVTPSAPPKATIVYTLSIRPTLDRLCQNLAGGNFFIAFHFTNTVHRCVLVL